MRSDPIPPGSPTPDAAPRDTCLHELFEAQAARTPDAIAATFGDRSLTYRTLNRRANQLARHLRELGVGPEVLVGLCLDRSLEMLVGLLGVLKAGGAYVPLDPAYPQARLSFMMADARVGVLVTRERLLGTLPRHDAQTVCLDTDWPAIARRDTEDMDSGVLADHLAYVIYTSGSTGQPKGVMVAHRGLRNLSEVQVRTFGVGPRDRVLQFASLSFDAATFEIVLALRVWATLCLAPADDLAPGPPLLELLRGSAITVATLPPSALSAVPDDDLPALRLLLVAGEACTAALVERWAGGRRFHNLYGPTEATIWSTQAACHAGGPPPSIGRPIAATQVVLLDAQLDPVPPGVAGELCLGGVGVARGYLRRPGLTAERFIPHPCDETPGARLYRTGDRARWLPDGDLEFLGRLDQQVKLRGVRIELGEIEAVLGQHSAVQDTVVLAREDHPGDRRLVAYVIPTDPALASVPELRGFLIQRLPLTMVPSTFVLCERFPLTPNGKVDRQALPAPSGARPALGPAYDAPQTPAQEGLVRIWTEVLELEPIGIRDNFFALGGHSLSAVVVLTRIQADFGVTLPLQTIFEAPTVAELATRLDAAQRQAHRPPGPPPAPPDTAPSAPLSFGQEEIWVAVQLRPPLPIYNESFTLYLPGPVDRQALATALDRFVQRHAVLRTAFVSQRAQPVQVVRETVEVALPFDDLRTVSASAREAHALELATRAARRPFDLAQPPLLRATLAQLDETDFRLYLTLHHIVMDAVSVYNVLLPELWALYEAARTGTSADLPELPLQHGDHARRQRHGAQQEASSSHLAYWLRQLADAPPLQLPTDRPRPRSQTFRGACQSFALSRDLVAGLRELSQREGVTLFMTLLATFQVLLWHYRPQDEVVLGTVDAGRGRPELEPLFGYFLNTFVLRTDLSGQPTFRQLLRRVHDVCVQAYAHKDVPFSTLLAQLQPHRDGARHPLFSAAVVMEPPVPVHASGWTVSQQEVHTETSKIDLTLELEVHADRLLGRLKYSSDLFDARTIDRMRGRFQRLAASVAADPEQRIAALPLLTEDERRRFHAGRYGAEPTQPFVAFPRAEIEQSIPRRFAKQVAAHPHRIAVETRAHSWTYAELHRRATDIARILLARGAGGAERIALYFDHEAPMIAALLGVLYAGKAYVPLDPTHPRERLLYMLDDVQAPVVLTHTRTLAGARTLASESRQIVDIDDPPTPSGAGPPLPTVAPETLAYILYTSGSTGVPKGVMQTHRNVLHFIRAYTNNLHISAEDRLTLLSSYSFDASVMAVFGALLNGATLCPIDVHQETPASFADWMRARAITLYHSTPTLYRHFVGTLDETEALPAVRLVVLGGEAVSLADVDLYRRHFSPDCLLVNGFGPTESTVSVQQIIDQPTARGLDVVPIGHPVADTEILLLDDAGETVPLFGEIAIRSAHLALGYWRQPEQTREVFLPDPEGGDRRLYRTGDLGRRQADGSLVFAGRRDGQIKIRGFRVEPGEIEAVLGRHPAVRETVVVATEAQPGPPLTAYVVPEQGHAPTGNDLRELLQQKLPPYMVPSAFVFLDSLPLSPSGKVDQRALPAPEVERIEATYVAPRNGTQRQLTALWEQVLRRNPIGIRDDFFELGGHSLMAMQLCALIEEAFDEALPIATLFRAPTIETMARVLDDRGHSARWSSLVPIHPWGSRPPLFCVHGVTGDPFIYRHLALHLGDDQPVYGLQARGLDRESPPHRRIEEMAAHYLSEMRAVQPGGPYHLAGFCFGGTVAFEIARQLRANGEQVGLLALFDAHAKITRSLPTLEAVRWWLSHYARRARHHLGRNGDRPGLRGKIAYLARALRQRGAASPPDPADDSPLAEIHVRASRSYAPGFYPGTVTVFRSEMARHPSYDPQLGWQLLARNGVEIHDLAGFHHGMFDEPQVAVLAGKLRRSLEAVPEAAQG